MIKKILPLFATLLFLNACNSLDGIRTIEGYDGLYRVDEQPENVLRNKDGEVVTSKEDAEKVIRSLGGFPALVRNFRSGGCNIKAIHRAKVKQFEAERFLQAKRWQDAVNSLEAANAECGELHFISAQEYDLAVAYQGLGQKEKALDYAKRFLRHASAVRPAVYVQSDYPDRRSDETEWEREQREFRHYRDLAKNFVEGRGQLAWREIPAETAKFYHNGFFRPGGNLRAGTVILPAFGFGGPMGSFIGLQGYKSWGQYGVGANYLHSSTTDSYFGAKLRRSVYQSEKRDLNADVFVAGRTHKKYSYRLDGYGYYRDVKVVDEAFDPGAGFGVTKRFLPEFGVSGGLIVYSDQIDDEVDFSSTLYSFYDLNSLFTFNAGWIYNRPMTSISFAFLHIGYNWREKELNVLVQGIDF